MWKRRNNECYKLDGKGWKMGRNRKKDGKKNERNDKVR